MSEIDPKGMEAAKAEFFAPNTDQGGRLERAITAYLSATSPRGELVAEDRLDECREKLAALQDVHRRKMNEAADKAMKESQSENWSEVSIASTESERHREAFSALRTAIDIFDGLYSGDRP
ncbi:hypothetical protein FF80_03297 [Devosia sp. LC5]|uniref:hypothetical protein n=1 Tax=Devosia sp. LC5 TaxID=1502724 RepID=UPI0004E33376|nr:hypothetical protein [Devosia sp. LC5]KFC62730.1 hypothetical protein FF80_03297 [Devosia sp. LC5]